jgi:RNA polymerase sigma factor (sigma-70 family)
MTTTPSTVHVVDDDASFRTAVARLLRASGYQVVLYESADRFLERSPSSEVGCILLDVHMPGLTGLELQDRLAELGSQLPIVFLTGHGDFPSSVRAVKGGAEDYLAKPVSKDDLLSAIGRAVARAEQSRDRIARHGSLKELVATLTPREREVFTLLVHGKRHKQIAYDLGMSERTVKAHRHQVMEKLRVGSLAEAVLIAERIGITGGELPPR